MDRETPVNVPDVTTAGTTHSATSNEDCKSTGHTPGDGQLPTHSATSNEDCKSTGHTPGDGQLPTHSATSNEDCKSSGHTPGDGQLPTHSATSNEDCKSTGHTPGDGQLPTHSATSNEDCKSTGHTPGDGQLPTHSATSNEDCKSTGHTPGDGQLRDGDSTGCLTENSGQSDVQGAREGLHHGKGSGGVTVSGRCQSRGHDAEVDSLVDGDSPRLPSGDLRRDSQDTHHTLHSKNSWNERRDLEEHLGRGRDSPP
ncbi:hypothetical protein ACOMHN_033494 [Nucella lapillus]